MNSRIQHRQIQDAGSTRYIRSTTEAMEEQIRAKTGINNCVVTFGRDCVVIHAQSYADFLLAKSAIKDETILDIVMSHPMIPSK